MRGKAWDNKKSLMEIHNKQFRSINWTPECKTQASGGRERHVRDPWLFMQTNWKLTSNLTSDLQQCTSMYVLRKAQKSVGRKKPSPQIVKLFEPHPGLAAGGCIFIKNSTISVHIPNVQAQQASQQTPQRFFTREVQLTASKGTTTNSQIRHC